MIVSGQQLRVVLSVGWPQGQALHIQLPVHLTCSVHSVENCARLGHSELCLYISLLFFRIVALKNHIDDRPRSRSSRTQRSTRLFCRSTLSTSRRFYDSTRLGWFPINLVDLRPCWPQFLACAGLLHGHRRKKICVQSPDAFPVPSGRPSFPFLFPPLNIFIVGLRDHKMRSMRPVP